MTSSSNIRTNVNPSLIRQTTNRRHKRRQKRYAEVFTDECLCSFIGTWVSSAETKRSLIYMTSAERIKLRGIRPQNAALFKAALSEILVLRIGRQKKIFKVSTLKRKIRFSLADCLRRQKSIEWYSRCLTRTYLNRRSGNFCWRNYIEIPLSLSDSLSISRIFLFLPRWWWLSCWFPYLQFHLLPIHRIDSNINRRTLNCHSIAYGKHLDNSSRVIMRWKCCNNDARRSSMMPASKEGLYPIRRRRQDDQHSQRPFVPSSSPLRFDDFD